MKKFLTVFFVTLGVIFFVLILFATYFYIADPLNLKPLLFGNTAVTTMENVEPSNIRTPSPESESASEPVPADSSDRATIDSNPLLNETQEQTLQTFGIDPAGLPSEITLAQEACFADVLGADRVAEIVAGDSPSVSEFFQARECL